VTATFISFLQLLFLENTTNFIAFIARLFRVIILIKRSGSILNKFIFIVEKTAFEGVKRIAKKVALDFEKVSGLLPAITASRHYRINAQ